MQPDPKPDPTRLVTLDVAIEQLNAAGVPVSRSTLYRWNADRVAAGKPSLFRQPGGTRGRIFVVPADIEAHIRNSCSATGVAA